MHLSSQIVHHNTIHEQLEIQENVHSMNEESNHVIQGPSIRRLKGSSLRLIQDLFIYPAPQLSSTMGSEEFIYHQAAQQHQILK